MTSPISSSPDQSKFKLEFIPTTLADSAEPSKSPYQGGNFNWWPVIFRIKLDGTTLGQKIMGANHYSLGPDDDTGWDIDDLIYKAHNILEGSETYFHFRDETRVNIVFSPYETKTRIELITGNIKR